LLFLFVLIHAVASYLLCAILYPSAEKNEHFKDIYFARRKWFFGLLALMMILDIIDTNWKASFGLEGFGAFHVFVWGAIIIGSLVAARTSNQRFHEVWAIVFLVLMSTFEYMNFGTLRAD
jgi:hypothetical protein